MPYRSYCVQYFSAISRITLLKCLPWKSKVTTAYCFPFTAWENAISTSGCIEINLDLPKELIRLQGSLTNIFAVRAALEMNLDGFPSPMPAQAAMVSESSEMVGKCLTETRTISHLLHPPLLDRIREFVRESCVRTAV